MKLRPIFRALTVCLALGLHPAHHLSSLQPDDRMQTPPLGILRFERERFLMDLQWDERAYARSDSFPVIGRWPWGPCRAVAARDTVVFMGNGALFQVLSSPDSGQPEIIAEHITAGLVVDIAVNDSFAFVLSSNKITVLDISAIPTLTLLTEFTLPFIAPARLTLHGSYAYVLFFNGRFAVVDLSNPSSPFMRGNVFATFGDARALQAFREVAFVGGLDSEYLTVLNVHNPDSPYVVTNLPTERILRLDVSDTLLFLTGLFNHYRYLWD